MANTCLWIPVYIHTDIHTDIDRERQSEIERGKESIYPTQDNERRQTYLSS